MLFLLSWFKIVHSDDVVFYLYLVHSRQKKQQRPDWLAVCLQAVHYIKFRNPSIYQRDRWLGYKLIRLNIRSNVRWSEHHSLVKHLRWPQTTFLTAASNVIISWDRLKRRESESLEDAKDSTSGKASERATLTPISPNSHDSGAQTKHCQRKPLGDLRPHKLPLSVLIGSSSRLLRRGLPLCRRSMLTHLSSFFALPPNSLTHWLSRPLSLPLYSSRLL